MKHAPYRIHASPVKHGGAQNKLNPMAKTDLLPPHFIKKKKKQNKSKQRKNKNLTEGELTDLAHLSVDILLWRPYSIPPNESMAIKDPSHHDRGDLQESERYVLHMLLSLLVLAVDQDYFIDCLNKHDGEKGKKKIIRR